MFYGAYTYTSFNALEEPNVTHLNYEGRWENHEREFRADERSLRRAPV